MSHYKKESRVPTVILWVVVSLTTLGLIAAIVFGFARMDQNNDPTESDPPIETTGADQPNTEIPVITPGTDQGGEETDPPEETTEPGDISVDILDANKENEKENQPHIVGNVSILPGVKEEDHETND